MSTDKQGGNVGQQQSPVGQQKQAQQASSVNPTGVPGLDEVLGGGFARGALGIIVGPPGSGKTTLACQMAFACARSGRSALVLAALSETTNKLIAHLRTFAFFDSHLITSRLQFLSLQHVLTQGLDATADEMVAIARRARAELVVLDGFRGVRESELNQQAARRFLYAVGARLGVLGTTTIITSEAEPHDPSFFTEATTADAIVGLHFGLEGVLQRRALEVVKVRGAQLLPGLHGLQLSRQGITVFPRLEAMVVAEGGRRRHAAGTEEPQAPPQEQISEGAEGAEPARARFDVPELDAMLGGGLTRSTSTVVAGSPGTGKTLLALHYALAGVAAGEKVVYLSLRETRQQLLRKADTFALGSQLRAALAPGGTVRFQGWDPVELHPDVVADQLLAEIERAGAQRLVIDSIGEIEHAIQRSGDAGRVSDYLAALLVALRRREVTALVTKETPLLVASQLDLALDPIAVLAENVLWLQQTFSGGALHRLLSVVKMRFSAHDMRVHEFSISAPQGVQVLPFTPDGQAPRGTRPAEHT